MKRSSTSALKENNFRGYLDKNIEKQQQTRIGSRKLMGTQPFIP